MFRKIGQALVLGAGIGGLRTALDLAETGYGVVLIDRAPVAGGILSQLDFQFPTDLCGMCRLLPALNRDGCARQCLRRGFFHENIELLTGTEMVSLEGQAGSFRARLRRKPALVDPVKCLGCGQCLEVCPVELPDAFNAGLTRRKAVYLPSPHARPKTYIIDAAACNRCGACQEICPTRAINMDMDGRGLFRLLVVDDEPIVRESLRDWLQDEGYRVDTAAAGLEALEKLEANRYELMLLDIKMPGMDGVEVLKRAKDLRPELTVVLMTAYATVETAVEAMKIGALDYLIKPFDPAALFPMIDSLYEKFLAAGDREIQVGAVILAAGVEFFDPKTKGDFYGHGVYPGVVTNLEFERMLSGTGPGGGLGWRKGQQPIDKIAWVQCVGSRDHQVQADYCSSICCLIALKEAVLAKEKLGPGLETAIFHMDIRAWGQEHQRYLNRAVSEYGVRLERARIHSLVPNWASGRTTITYLDANGSFREEPFDIIVLSTGQRPSTDLKSRAPSLGLDLNPWGFVQTEPFSSSRTKRSGLHVSGSCPGLVDIRETVIQASAAAQEASEVIHTAGGSLAPVEAPTVPFRQADSSPPHVLALLCSCSGRLELSLSVDRLTARMKSDQYFHLALSIEDLCRPGGLAALAAKGDRNGVNRILIGACPALVQEKYVREISRETGLDRALFQIVDIHSFLAWGLSESEVMTLVETELRAGLAQVKAAEPHLSFEVPVIPGALVVGGGLAGLTAALSLANHGFQVNLVEKEEILGGHLNWLKQTLTGENLPDLLNRTLDLVRRHPLITIHLGSQVVESQGQVGRFKSLIRTAQKEVIHLDHGVTVLAVGGREAPPREYAYGQSPRIVSLRELELKLENGTLNPSQLGCVVMIQCVGSREEPRNYCSRVCCPSALKHAFYLREKNPSVRVYILYRDMMTPGFLESHFTEARRAGVVFIHYRREEKPQIRLENDSVLVTVHEPVLNLDVQVSADLVVLAAGIAPCVPRELASAVGLETDEDGFIRPMNSKWRPVDTLKEGVFACGLCLSPGSIREAIVTAKAAASRALTILNRPSLKGGTNTAQVRPSLCALCGTCLEACSFDARTLDLELGQVLVNQVLCQGCGACAAACPSGASYLNGFQDRLILETIDAALMGAAG